MIPTFVEVVRYLVRSDHLMVLVVEVVVRKMAVVGVILGKGLNAQSLDMSP